MSSFGLFFGIIQHMEDTLIKWATFAIAIVGCVLGIVNFVVDLVRRKPRARATIRDCYAPNDSCWNMSALIHVVNTGESTIYFEQFGLCVRSKKGFLHVKPEGVNGEQIPQNLLPGQSVDVVIDDKLWISPEADNVVCAFARISTGKEFYTQRLRKQDIARYRTSAKESLDFI